MQWCWVNFQCRGVLLIWMIVGQGPAALKVGAGGRCFDIFNLVYHFSFLSPSLWETARYRLKYCLKGPLSPKQPTNQPVVNTLSLLISSIKKKIMKQWEYGTVSFVSGQKYVPVKVISQIYWPSQRACIYRDLLYDDFKSEHYG